MAFVHPTMSLCPALLGIFPQGSNSTEQRRGRSCLSLCKSRPWLCFRCRFCQLIDSSKVETMRGVALLALLTRRGDFVHRGNAAESRACMPSQQTLPRSNSATALVRLAYPCALGESQSKEPLVCRNMHHLFVFAYQLRSAEFCTSVAVDNVLRRRCCLLDSWYRSRNGYLGDLTLHTQPATRSLQIMQGVDSV